MVYMTPEGRAARQLDAVAAELDRMRLQGRYTPTIRLIGLGRADSGGHSGSGRCPAGSQCMGIHSG